LVVDDKAGKGEKIYHEAGHIHSFLELIAAAGSMALKDIKTRTYS